MLRLVISSLGVFVPFHYGDWDDPTGSGGGNELISDWDAISNQSAFIRTIRYPVEERFTSVS